MFGIKIISGKKYQELLDAPKQCEQKKHQLDEQCDDLLLKLNTAKADVNHLRNQLNAKIKEVEDLKKEKENSPARFFDFIIDGGKCMNCKHELKDCKKFDIKGHTLCIIPNESSFKKKQGK